MDFQDDTLAMAGKIKNVQSYPTPITQFASHDLSNYRVFWVDEKCKEEHLHKLQLDLIKDGFDISQWKTLAEAEGAVKAGTKEVIFICSGELAQDVIKYIDENRGKLNWCIIYCLEKNDYKSL